MESQDNELAKSERKYQVKIWTVGEPAEWYYFSLYNLKENPCKKPVWSFPHYNNYNYSWPIHHLCFSLKNKKYKCKCEPPEYYYKWWKTLYNLQLDL